MSAAILMAGVAVASAQSVGEPYGRGAGDPHRGGHGRLAGAAVHRVRDRRPSLASDRAILDRVLIERRTRPQRDHRPHDLAIDRAILDRALTERRPGRDLDRHDGFASDRAVFDRAMAEGRRQHPARHGSDHAGRDYGMAPARGHGHPDAHGRPGRHDTAVADHPRHDHSAHSAAARPNRHVARRHGHGHDHAPATAETAGSATEHHAATHPAHGRDHTVRDTTRHDAPVAHGEARHTAPPPEQQPSRTEDRITKVQTALNQQGFDVGNPDGKLGTRTVDAIKAFQIKRGFKATGKLDHATVDAILAAAIVAPGMPGSSSSGPQAPSPVNAAPAAGEGTPVQPIPADPATTGQGGLLPATPPVIERVPAETPVNPSAPDPSAPVAAPPSTPAGPNNLDAPGR